MGCDSVLLYLYRYSSWGLSMCSAFCPIAETLNIWCIIYPEFCSLLILLKHTGFGLWPIALIFSCITHSQVICPVNITMTVANMICSGSVLWRKSIYICLHCLYAKLPCDKQLKAKMTKRNFKCSAPELRITVSHWVVWTTAKMRNHQKNHQPANFNSQFMTIYNLIKEGSHVFKTGTSFPVQNTSGYLFLPVHYTFKIGCNGKKKANKTFIFLFSLWKYMAQ